MTDEAFFPRSWIASDPELCRVRMTAREVARLLAHEPQEETAGPPPTDGPVNGERVFLTTPQVAERLGINRKTLDKWAHKYAHLPGGPTKAGKPRARRTHYRWDSSTLDEWLDNVKAREAVRPPRSRSRAAGRV